MRSVPPAAQQAGLLYSRRPAVRHEQVWDEAREALEDVFGRYSIAALAAAEREERASHEAAPARR